MDIQQKQRLAVKLQKANNDGHISELISYLIASRPRLDSAQASTVAFSIEKAACDAHYAQGYEDAASDINELLTFKPQPSTDI